MLQNKNEKEWFEEWFDSPYYHVLYKDRDSTEAQQFITNLITYLKPNQLDLFLDVACGKGRHAIFVEQLGYQIDGFDLSENSIAIAKKQENKNLKFYVNDIRVPLKTNHYNFAFNLFTSFGYFENENDNQIAINAIAKSLKQDGILVLDFMNCKKVLNQLEKQETKSINNISFNICKNFNDGYIVKDIMFTDKGNTYNFQEKVKALSLNQFKKYFNTANLKIEAIFGDYYLNNFDENNSERLILVAKK
jgi:SAM-dependent methyltransferase